MPYIALNYIALAVLGIFGNSGEAPKYNLLSAPYVNAVLEGDAQTAESIFRDNIAQKISLDLANSYGESSVKQKNFWKMMVRPTWLDLSAKILSLNPQFMILTLGSEILKTKDTVERVQSSRSLQKRHVPDKLGIEYSTIPGLYDLAYAKDSESASEQLEKQVKKIADRSEASYQKILKEIATRLKY